MNQQETKTNEKTLEDEVIEDLTTETKNLELVREQLLIEEKNIVKRIKMMEIMIYNNKHFIADYLEEKIKEKEQYIKGKDK